MSIAHFSAFRTAASQSPAGLMRFAGKQIWLERIARHLCAIGQPAWTGQLPRFDQNNNLNVA